MTDYDVAVVGGGIVGVAIAYGLARSGQKTAIFDEGDVAFRAARGNFGLIWVQGKGDGCPEYAQWTRHSADNWQKFKSELEDLSGIDMGYRRPGGLSLCLTEKEYVAQTRMISRLIDASKGRFRCEMLTREALTDRLPELGPDVIGASFSPMDGHVNPLLLLRALHTSFKRQGGKLRIEPVVDIHWKNRHFHLRTNEATSTTKKVVLAAGLNNLKLAPMIGLNVPVRPQRGQILVTERLKPFLNYPTSLVRQTQEGSVQLGDSHEEVGFDDGTSLRIMADIAQRARRIFPQLEKARIVRAWSALRILAPDGLPIYDQSSQFPGAFTASSHSGVTLAAAHALDFAKYVAEGELPQNLNAMSERRFHVH